MKPAPVMIMAGGTGGHVFPALAVAECLRQRQVPVIWLGTRSGLEARLVPQAQIPIEWVNVAGLRGSGWRRWLRAPLMLSRALWQALQVLYRCQPRLVLGMGGFVSGPGGVAARCLRIPLVIHEQNAIAGTTNRWLAKIAQQILVAFPNSFDHLTKQQIGTTLVGNPVRAAIAALPPPKQRFQQHIEQLQRPRLLVLGGSQGALVLNRSLPHALAQLVANGAVLPEVWHQTGAKHAAATQAIYQQLGISARLDPFIDDMAAAYGWADLVVCRAGALTVTELCAAGIGALLIPFPYAIDDHQTANAGFLLQHGAAELLPEADWVQQPELLTERLQHLLSQPEQLLAMAQAARQLALPEAAERVADICLQQARVQL